MKPFREHRSLINITALFLMALGSIGCQPNTPELLPPEEILQRSGARMQSLAGFHFMIERSGAPAYLDTAETLVFRRAEGDYVSPDRAQATVRIITPGLVAEVEIRSLDGRYWETDFLSGNWIELPPDQGFNPSVLFDSQSGFQSILGQDMTNLYLRGTEQLEEVPGQELYVIEGFLKGDRIAELSYGLIGSIESTVITWISPATFDMQRIVITTPGVNGAEETRWQVDFWNFGMTPTITRPDSEP